MPDKVTVNEKVKTKVDALIASTQTKFNEEDRAQLSTLSEEMLDKMTPVEQPPAAGTAATAAAPASATVAAAPTSAVTEEEEEKPKTVDEYIAAAPEAIREVLDQGVRMQRARREKIVAGLTANERCKFTKDELGKMPITQLENLAALAAVEVDPAPEGGAPVARAGITANNEFPKPPSLFPAQ